MSTKYPTVHETDEGDPEELVYILARASTRIAYHNDPECVQMRKSPADVTTLERWKAQAARSRHPCAECVLELDRSVPETTTRGRTCGLCGVDFTGTYRDHLPCDGVGGVE